MHEKYKRRNISYLMLTFIPKRNLEMKKRMLHFLSFFRGSFRVGSFTILMRYVLVNGEDKNKESPKLG